MLQIDGGGTGSENSLNLEKKFEQVLHNNGTNYVFLSLLDDPDISLEQFKQGLLEFVSRCGYVLSENDVQRMIYAITKIDPKQKIFEYTTGRLTDTLGAQERDFYNPEDIDPDLIMSEGGEIEDLRMGAVEVYNARYIESEITKSINEQFEKFKEFFAKIAKRTYDKACSLDSKIEKEQRFLQSIESDILFKTRFSSDVSRIDESLRMFFVLTRELFITKAREYFKGKRFFNEREIDNKTKAAGDDGDDRPIVIGPDGSRERAA